MPLVTLPPIVLPPPPTTPEVDWPWQACASSLLVDGFLLDSVAYGIGGLEAPESMVPRRGENYVVGDRPGRRWRPKVAEQRTITLSMWVRGIPAGNPVPWGDTPERFRANYRMIRKLFAPLDRLLVLTRNIALPDGVLTLTAEAEVGNQMDLAAMGGVTIGTFSVDLVMPDPYWYGPEVVATLGLPLALGGLTFPVVFSATFGGGGGGGEAILDNPGEVAVSPTIRLDGPLTNPFVTHQGTGRTVGLTYDLAEGEYLLIDFATRSVLLNGTASRYAAVTTAQWFDLAPGPNTLIFRGAAGAGYARVAIRPPYN